MKYDKLELEFQMEEYKVTIMRVSFGKISWVIPMHNHSENSYELHYIVSGKGSVILNGTKYDVTPNMLFVTGPLIDHEQIPDDTDPMVEYCINLNLVKTEERSGGLIHRFADTPSWIGPDSGSVGNTMQQIYRELGCEECGKDLAVTGLMQCLLVQLARLCTVLREDAAPVRHFPLPSTNFCLIEDAFLYEYKTLTLEQLANRLGLSVRQTERLLQKNYKNTFKSLKAKSRMAAAAAALTTTDKTLTEIAEDIGYTSVEHFCRAFKTAHQISASEYRTQQRAHQ